MIAATASSAAPIKTVGTGTLLRVLWRSFFFLAVTNFERMQNVGFAWCMWPALKRLYSGEDLKAAMKRHLEFFNSHPYMASALLGAAVRFEEEVAAGRSTPDRVQMFKRCLMGPMAAIGDSFFWSSLRPFGAAWAIAGVLSDIIWAPIAFLVLYNLFHLFIRSYGLFAGYHRGEQIIERLPRLELVRFADLSHYVTGFFLGIAGALFADRAASTGWPLGDGLEPFLLVVLTVIFLLCLKRKMAMPILLYSFTLGCLALVLGLNALFPLV
ncbi:MAG: PTS system mannose/fructose/sorbose family transporter subunit IID [Myxococcales bacterium]|nr:PTS system mannose/fructose/sorbose family transporter subunit IID [Myxococcales bacterium]